MSALTDMKLFAISEVSEITGVNSVTLRAWQRRYGLLVPLRTTKRSSVIHRSRYCEDSVDS